MAAPTATPEATATEAAPEATSANTISTGSEALDKVGAVIDTGETPWGPVAGFDAIWLQVAVNGGGAVVRIDPATNQVAATIELDVLPIAGGPDSPVVSVAIGEQGVWATGWRGASPEAAEGVLLRIDPDTNEIAQTIELPLRPRGLAIDDSGAIWVSSHIDNSVVGVDSESGSVLATLEIEHPWAIALSPDALWVANNDDGSLTQIDLATTEVVETFMTGAWMIPNIKYGADALWLSNFNPEAVGEVQRIDPATGEPIARIAMSGPGDIAIDEQGVWVLSNATQEITQIDPATNQVVAHYTGGPPDLWGIAAGYGSVWVSNVMEGTLTRIDP
jgi:DNA-binding beta-propeller fold protein YncE